MKGTWWLRRVGNAVAFGDAHGSMGVLKYAIGISGRDACVICEEGSREAVGGSRCDRAVAGPGVQRTGPMYFARGVRRRYRLHDGYVRLCAGVRLPARFKLQRRYLLQRAGDVLHDFGRMRHDAVWSVFTGRSAHLRPGNLLRPHHRFVHPVQRQRRLRRRQ